jgi:hypothetical protein
MAGEFTLSIYGDRQDGLIAAYTTQLSALQDQALAARMAWKLLVSKSYITKESMAVIRNVRERAIDNLIQNCPSSALNIFWSAAKDVSKRRKKLQPILDREASALSLKLYAAERTADTAAHARMDSSPAQS